MSGGPAHAARVDTEQLSAAEAPTRRLPLNVLWGRAPRPMPPPGPVLDALREIHQYLCTAERDALARYGVPEFHLVVRPVSPAAPPPPQQMQQITQAVRTLAGLGMLAMPDDADSRDQHS